jgi:opacity protein-like surface antigen
VILLAPCLYLSLSANNGLSAEMKGTYIPEGTYATVNIGLVKTDNSDIENTDPTLALEYDLGYAINGGVGYNFGNNMRVETEVSYIQSDLDQIDFPASGAEAVTGDLEAVTFLVNGYLDFTNGGPFTTFVTAGVGIANIDLNFKYPTISAWGDDNVLAYQVGAGIGYMLTETLTIDLKYRFLQTEDIELGDLDISYASHTIYMGARFGL